MKARADRRIRRNSYQSLYSKSPYPRIWVNAGECILYISLFSLFFFFPFSIAPHRIFCDRISSILEPSTRAAKSIREKVSNYEIPLLDYSRRNRVHVTRKVSNEFFSLIILANVVEQISLPPSPSFNSSREIVQ